MALFQIRWSMGGAIHRSRFPYSQRLQRFGHVLGGSLMGFWSGVEVGGTKSR